MGILLNATFAGLANNLGSGAVTARGLAEAALQAIAADPRAFTLVDTAGARAAADAVDAERALGRSASPFAGIPVSIKDLFDVAGQVTAAGSTILRHAAPASADAAVVARLRRAGLVIVGRTQMSEFAFTGIGLNPHGPNPVNPVAPERVVGGSSGGAAVSVALGQAAGALGSDTGGSVRVPAAFCGLVGFKPTARRVSRAGVFPLSTTLDSVGPIARTVACCRTLDAIIADAPAEAAASMRVSELRLGVPDSFFLDDADPPVTVAFERALAELSRAGAAIERFDFPESARIVETYSRGSISSAESFAFHRRMGLLRQRERYDPNVLVRVEGGAGLSAADYLDMLAIRADIIAAAEARLKRFDAIVAPTSPILPPRLAEVAEAAGFARANGLVLRNPLVFNFLDRCAVSLPLGDGIGLMLVGPTLGDARLLAIADAVEAVACPTL
jgi:aspartyl-tRNA(Asn)/glutamyl-tRNA(Gln) amidotransferase subunit A